MVPHKKTDVVCTSGKHSQSICDCSRFLCWRAPGWLELHMSEDITLPSGACVSFLESDVQVEAHTAPPPPPPTAFVYSDVSANYHALFMPRHAGSLPAGSQYSVPKQHVRPTFALCRCVSAQTLSLPSLCRAWRGVCACRVVLK